MKPIRIALIGVGNCSSSLVQGLHYYSSENAETKSGLMHYLLGGYTPKSILVSAAFDIDKRKVGLPLTKAIFSSPNCTFQFQKDIPESDCYVSHGYIIDSISPTAANSSCGESGFFPLNSIDSELNSAKNRIVKIFKQSNTEIVVNLLPVGSELNSQFYAECAIEAGAGFVNGIPVFLTKTMGNAFKNAKLPIIGDDVKSQVGATVIHQVLTQLFSERGIKINSTYQLNVGGNTDFLNMLDRSRLESKKESKTHAVLASMPAAKDFKNIHVGPSDYIPHLKDNKICFINITGEQFGGLKLELDLKLSVQDSPNSAGVLFDAIRAIAVAKDRELSGPIEAICPYLFKSPPVFMPHSLATDEFESFIKGGTRKIIQNSHL